MVRGYKQQQFGSRDRADRDAVRVEEEKPEPVVWCRESANRLAGSTLAARRCLLLGKLLVSSV